MDHQGFYLIYFVCLDHMDYCEPLNRAESNKKEEIT